MKKIKNPEKYEVSRFDGVRAAAIYKGPLTELNLITDELKWRTDIDKSRAVGFSVNVLTLKEIVEQTGNLFITIIEEGPLSGCVLQYGNYGDSWWQIGDLDGYA